MMQVKRNTTLTWHERLYLPEVLNGLKVTFTHFSLNLGNFIWRIFSPKTPRKIVTVYYPEEKVTYPPAFRGRPVLVMDSDGSERCVACGLCEKICPAFCIFIQAGETDQDKERFPKTFIIDMSRCIFCGLCEEACPKEAIVMSDECELAVYDRRNLVFHKHQLLVPIEKLSKRLNFIRTSYEDSR